MKLIDEPLPGLKLFKLDIFEDSRGFFTEKYNAEKFAKLGITNNFVQDNFSRSKSGVVRGLHYQRNPDQAKLVCCTAGSIYDVAVDLRMDSPTLGKYYGAELTCENGLMLYIPAGFAHGFCSLTRADVMYKVDGLYNKAGEGGILFDDVILNINWPVKYPEVSDRDKVLQTWGEYLKNPAF